MLMDARELSDGQTLDCDVCIVGAGAAGIAMACELDGSGLSVILLESGGTRFDKTIQELYQGSTDDEGRHSPPDMYRKRMFGGSTTIWGGRCLPMDPIDFEKRDFVPHSGWPIGRRDLDTFYLKAQEYAEAGSFDYTAGEAFGPAAVPTIPGFDSHWIDTDRLERFSCPTDFGKRYQAVIKASRTV